MLGTRPNELAILELRDQQKTTLVVVNVYGMTQSDSTEIEQPFVSINVQSIVKPNQDRNPRITLLLILSMVAFNQSNYRVNELVSSFCSEEIH
ncbi:hypothetical protein KQX54_007760 [Cotesia glomerata]|uniref:Uncharacterized protein n=1 Tax=Cotesia glomerata TaxID=32391 RepID=A0AAV7IU91_COTGL|nr:hypothetical protein KQX54_007760 [Cotesia glomerata]